MQTGNANRQLFTIVGDGVWKDFIGVVLEHICMPENILHGKENVTFDSSSKIKKKNCKF